MRKDTPVSQIMTKNVLRLAVSDSLTKAESLMKKNHIRHLPVVEEEHIVGMLSLSDLLRISFADAVDAEGEEIELESTVYDLFTVEQVMTKKVAYISSNHTIEEAANLLIDNEFHALPVVDDDCLTGIVTTTDIIKYFLGALE